ncbi:hypothetical protein ACT17G_05450 [Bacillus velezensis]|uniref:hypothetical protein n=1 Tax=Bacillus TaxID=1386 RepID=UPI00073A7CA8|nr:MULTISPECIES: hypothetical protein [Bacillus]ALV04314.1 hypothetical protein AVM03_19070 [Bacillus amyloliquefaciens]MDX7894370.1 hypothetical protein [Bacillus velezensis]MEE4559509.1 hypothetical protein [Bacillus velezensis]TNU35676.1 hypothetical protein FH493_01105 [Bacillus velezensis]UFH23662.1 hypothetical protein LOK79_05460 [Bacillus velezensis]
MYSALFFTLIDGRRLLLPITAVAFAATRVIDAFGILHISFASSTRHFSFSGPVAQLKKTRMHPGFSSAID